MRETLHEGVVSVGILGVGSGSCIRHPALNAEKTL